MSLSPSLSVHSFVYVLISLSLSLSVHSFVYVLISLSPSLSVHSFVYVLISLSPSLSVHSFVYVLISLSPSLSAHSGGVQPGINLLSSGFTFPSTSGGPGYIILSPGQKSPSFAPPLINMAQTTGASPIITMAMQNSESESNLKCSYNDT